MDQVADFVGVQCFLSPLMGFRAVVESSVYGLWCYVSVPRALALRIICFVSCLRV